MKVMCSVVYVCRSVILFTGAPIALRRVPSVQGPCPPSPHRTWTPAEIFKLVHYETRMVGKRAIRILLECFLVTHWDCSVNIKLIVIVGEWWSPKISNLDQ